MENKYVKLFMLLLSIMTTHVMIAQPCNSSTTYQQATTCQSTPYIFYRDTLTTAGTYNDTIVLPGGCDSIISLQLFVIPTIYTNIYDTMCAGSTYTFYSQTLTTAGVYTNTLFAANTFCDSIIVLNLAIRNSQNDTFRVNGTYCITRGGFGGGPQGYNFFGSYKTTPGIYVYHGGQLPTGSVCADSVVILNLKVGAAPVIIGTVRGGFGGTTITPDTIATCASTYNFYGRALTSNGNYSDTLISSLGCDSIFAYIYLKLNSGFNSAVVNGTSCNGAPFIWRGHSYASTGGGGGFGRPTVYYDTIAVAGGCDTIYTINVTRGNSPRTVTLRDSFCAGSTYTYSTYSFTTSGRDTLTVPSTTGGCDSTIVLILSYKAAPRYVQIDSFCQGSSYIYRGHTYTDSGAHFFTVPAPTGCDSIIQVNLSYKSAPVVNIVDSFCHGTSYTYRGVSYSTSGVHAITVPAPSGCDTVINLNLHYTTPPSRTIFDTICQGGSFVYGVDTFTTRGAHTFTVSTAGGCDSSITLNLTINRVPRTFVIDSFCQGTTYTYRSNTFTTAGRDTVYLPAASGCDTMVLLFLSYKRAPSFTKVDSFCQGSIYSFEGHTFTTAGSDTVYVSAATGCDTIAILSLSYKSIPVPVISQTGSILIVNPAAASYQWYLNGNEITGATSQAYTATESGVYTVSTSGINVCNATSAAFTLTGVGINQVSTSDIFSLYPNPNTGRFTIESSQYAGLEIMIYDMLGRQVYQKQMLSDKETIDMSTAPGGTYYLVMKGPQATRYVHFVIAQ